MESNNFKTFYNTMDKRIENLIKRADSAVPYVATLYYIEILYFMFFLNFLYGKTFSVVAGITLSFILTLHVIKLFNKKHFNRKLQLLIMDIHFAYSLAYFVNKLFAGYHLIFIDLTIIYFRFITALIEIFLIIVLTDDIIKNGYSD